MELKFILVFGLFVFADCAYVGKIHRDCSRPVGVENRTQITDQQMSASSHWDQHYASNARLHNHVSISSSGELRWGGWCTDRMNKKQFLQIDLGHERLVSGVASQGYVQGMFVSKYKIFYSTDGIHWKAYKQHRTNVTKNKTNATKIFLGNWDHNTVVKNVFPRTIKAKFVRFNPIDWHAMGYICMRVEIYECVDVQS